MSLNELIYEEIVSLNLEYNSEIMSDIVLINNDYKLDTPYIRICNRVRCDLFNNLKKKKKYIKYPTLEKWDIKCNSKNEICIICLDKINNDDLVYNLKCGKDLQLHIYHKVCFEKWDKDSCPYCRQVIT